MNETKAEGHKTEEFMLSRFFTWGPAAEKIVISNGQTA
jgi:hypothetical protein